MIIKVDARGLDCPMPVIKTKKALQESEEVVAIVDNETAKENVSKLAKSMNCNINIRESEGDYYIDIFKGEKASEEQLNEKSSIQDLVIFVGSDKMGVGSDELGEVLIKGYFYALTECEPYPKSILFVNSGVNLTIEGSPTLENLRKLESLGVEILSCGTCLDYYNIKDKLAVGGVSNMYTIVETMNNAKKVIRM
ncbi:MAG: sulfurtransferase-like selenium metabolism protein YedF [Firmicutes bacterium]|jgi:selenium metabolism protein YedF|nr:sulfurtransferase-like selenium metabolism protein YedF [Bacillota bacterium]